MTNRKPAGKASSPRRGERDETARRSTRHKPSRPKPKEPARDPRSLSAAAPRGVSARASGFPVQDTIWCRFFDDRLPYWVKQRYTPTQFEREPKFTEKDAEFFVRSVRSLSDLFTGRAPEAEATAYFEESRHRSAYLLYYVPLQAAKFVRLFHIHSAAIRKAISAASADGVFRVADLGSGPGTASLALLTWLVAEHDLHKPGSSLPPLEFHLLDTDGDILKDGASLVDEFRRIFGIAPERLSVHTHKGSIEEAPGRIHGKLHLTLIGNVFNEGLGSHEETVRAWLPALLKRSAGGGVLLVEPAVPENAAFLSRLRDGLLESGAIARDPAAIWGPCMHAGPCPLRESRDWCHFSAPGGVPGRWFRALSEGIGSERQWVKFSYLWLAAPGTGGRKPQALRRVVSDAIPDKRFGKVLLLCEPGQTARVPAPSRPPIGRGDLVTVKPLRKKKSFGERAE